MGICTYFKNLTEAAPAQPVFVTNADPQRLRYKTIKGGIVGEPQATEWYTADRLKSEGVVGVYRTVPQRKFAIV